MFRDAFDLFNDDFNRVKMSLQGSKHAWYLLSFRCAGSLRTVLFGYSSCLVCPDNEVEPWHDLDTSGILITITNVWGWALGG